MEQIILVIDWGLVVTYLKSLMTSFLFISLIILILIDVLTGKYKALKFGILDSSIGTSGMIKHTTIIILTVVVAITSRIIGINEIAYIFKAFYIMEYVTSILENLEALGIPFPDSFRKYFNRMRTKNENIKLGDENDV